MKKWIIALFFVSCGLAAGSRVPPQQIRVSLQFIEVAHTSLTEMLASDEKNDATLHDKAVALTKSGQAKILESCMVVCRNGKKSLIQSVCEEIYPTEYMPPGLPCGYPKRQDRYANGIFLNPFFRGITAFETRNIGSMFEVESTVVTNGSVNLILTPEMITRLRLENMMEHVDPWGDASVRMPIFESLRVYSSITVKPGKFEFISAFTPNMKAQGPVVTRKILVFVRADLLPLPKSSH